MGFTTPEFLLLLPVVGADAWWWARQSRPAIRFPDVVLFQEVPRGRAIRAVAGGAILRAGAGAMLVVAAAGPRAPDEQTRLPAEGVAMVLALDVSGSMAAPDATWDTDRPPISRLDAARRAFVLFVAGGTAPDGTTFAPRPADSIGLVTFAAVPQTGCPLTLNHSVLLRVVEELQPKIGLDAGTNVGDAIAEAVIRLDAAGGRKKVLILLSDGEHNVFKDGADATLTPRQAAQLAANLGIAVHTIDAAGDPPLTATAEERAQRQAGREALQAVAAITGGRAFAATSGPELLAVYREIDALQKSPTASFQYRRYFDYAPWFAVAAFTLLVLLHLVERTRWRIVP